MKSFKAFMYVLGLLLVSPALIAADLSGFWQHEELPAWIEVRFEGGVGTGTVVRNDEYPERVGRVLLKELVPDEGEADTWRGKVYAERLEEYKDGEISLPQANLMRIKVKVGFMSRTVEWNRVEAVPP
jgi:hypothetical protein